MDAQQIQELERQQQQLADLQAAGGGIAAGVMIFYLAIVAIMIVSMWKLFTKANQPGWASIIPIYNIIVMLQIVGRPVWWLVMLIIPFVNLIFATILMFDLAKAYGKGAGTGIGLLLLGPIFLPILAFGSAKYVGRVAAGSAPAPAAA